MTKRSDYYCDWCNKDEDSDADEGYAWTEGDEYPLGWWDVPGEDGVKHACPRCALGPAREEIIERRDAETARLLQ